MPCPTPAGSFANAEAMLAANAVQGGDVVLL
jgi:hypothetical protein